MTELNRLGGELRVSAQIGETPNLLVDFFQPVDYGSRWFVNPAFTLERSSSTVFDGRDKIARLQSTEVALGVSAGRQFGNWGALRATVTRAYGDVEVSIGDPSVGSAVTNLGGIGLEFGLDTIDRLAIPRSGTALAAEWFSARRSLGSDSEFDAATAFLLKPQTFGRNTFLHWWNLGAVYDTDVAGPGPLSLGGLFSLSGYAARELAGRHAAIGRLIYYRRLSDRSGGALGATLYAGASVEVGNAWQDSDDISVSDVLAAGSLFVVVDTLLGPIYLAYGAAEGGRESFYLFLGQTF
jgi:NTE family protein